MASGDFYEIPGMEEARHQRVENMIQQLHERFETLAGNLQGVLTRVEDLENTLAAVALALSIQLKEDPHVPIKE